MKMIMITSPRSRSRGLLLVLSSCFALSSSMMLLPFAQGFVFAAAGATSSSRTPFLLQQQQQARGGASRPAFKTTGTTTSLASTASPEAPASTAKKSSSSSSSLSWDDLADQLKEINEQDEMSENKPSPVLTLYRDTNGWCPFCERVWLCLEYKKIPYRERLVSLQDKPEWYKELVPTTLVPAILLHQDDLEKNKESSSNDDKSKSTKNQRQIVWESLDIMRVLDEAFPDTPRLVWENDEMYQAAIEQTTSLATAGFKFLYANRNATEPVSETDMAERKQAFLDELDALDAFMGKTKGPFLMGTKFSAADACLIPTMERWRYQLAPPLNSIVLEDGRPNIAAWWKGMEALPAYANRVAGDAYSWTAVASTFARYFGGDEADESVKNMIEKADAAAAKLREGFSTDSAWGSKDGMVSVKEAARQAATKLITNYEAVVADCTRAEPLSQKELARAGNPEAASAILQQVANVLLQIADSSGADDNDKWIFAAETAPLEVTAIAPKDRAQAAKAARTVAARLCVPRDLGAPAAKVLRGVLSIIANRVEEQE